MSSVGRRAIEDLVPNRWMSLTEQIANRAKVLLLCRRSTTPRNRLKYSSGMSVYNKSRVLSDTCVRIAFSRIFKVYVVSGLVRG